MLPTDPAGLFFYTLPYLGKGFLGIFIVTLILILSILVLNKVTSKAKN